MKIKAGQSKFIYDKLDGDTRRVFLACERVIRDSFYTHNGLIDNAANIAAACRAFYNKTVNETESKGIFLDMQGWRDLCSHACDKADWQLIAECLSEEFDEACIKEWEQQQNYV